MSDYKFGARVRVTSGFFEGLVGHLVYAGPACVHVKCHTAHGKQLLVLDERILDPVPDGPFSNFPDAGLRREIELITALARQHPASYAEALADARTELARRGLT